MVDLDRKLSSFRNAIDEAGGPGAWAAGVPTSAVRREPPADLWGEFGFPELANSIREISMLSGWSQPAATGGRALAVASAREREGKTSLAWALAIATAQDSGEHVILVECDLARPHLAGDLGVHTSIGLGEILGSEADVGEEIGRGLIQTRLTNLRLMPAGRGTRNPSRLLRSARMASVLDELRRRFAFVVLDVPAVLRNSETAALCGLADGVVFVVQAGVTDEREVQRALHLLSGATVHGVVLNRWRPATPRSLRRLVEE